MGRCPHSSEGWCARGTSCRSLLVQALALSLRRFAALDGAGVATRDPIGAMPDVPIRGSQHQIPNDGPAIIATTLLAPNRPANPTGRMGLDVVNGNRVKLTVGNLIGL